MAYALLTDDGSQEIFACDDLTWEKLKMPDKPWKREPTVAPTLEELHALEILLGQKLVDKDDYETVYGNWDGNYWERKWQRVPEATAKSLAAAWDSRLQEGFSGMCQ